MCDGEERKKKERRRRQRKKMNKIKTFMFGMSNLINVSKTNRVNIALRSQRDVVCKLFAFVCLVFLGAALTPYVHVQATILNLSHPSLRSIVLFDIRKFPQEKNSETSKNCKIKHYENFVH